MQNTSFSDPLLEAERTALLTSEGDAGGDDDAYVDYFYEEPGSDPGTLKISPDSPPPRIVVIEYTEERAIRRVLAHPDDCLPFLDEKAAKASKSKVWIDVQGLGNEAVLRRLGDIFKLHPLTLEDMVNVPQRPKIELEDNRVLLIARMVSPQPNGGGFISEQVSILVGRHYVLTVQEEQANDAFDPVRDRIRTNRGSIRQQGAPYLGVALLDAIIDGFFPILEDYAERIEELEDRVIRKPTPQMLENIYAIKRELLGLRFYIYPQVGSIKTLRDGKGILDKEVRVHIQDCYDHALQVLDMVEIYRELALNLMDLSLSATSNRMNEVMKVLAVVATIFSPLTFIAGIYGMNFDPSRSPWNMPELEWYWGYPACLAMMAIVAGSLITYFWRRGWFDSTS
jgi:magnesium transporter